MTAELAEALEKPAAETGDDTDPDTAQAQLQQEPQQGGEAPSDLDGDDTTEAGAELGDTNPAATGEETAGDAATDPDGQDADSV